MVHYTTIFKFLFVEMFANVVFVLGCFYSAVRLTLVREHCFIRLIEKIIKKIN